MNTTCGPSLTIECIVIMIDPNRVRKIFRGKRKCCMNGQKKGNTASMNSTSEEEGNAIEILLSCGGGWFECFDESLHLLSGE